MNTMKPQKVLHLHLEELKKKPNIQHDYIVSEKLDGWYVYADYSPLSGWDYLRSSAGRIIPSFKWVKAELDKELHPKAQVRIIFEAVIPGLDFYTANGRFNTTVNGYQEKDVRFYAHDILYINDLSKMNAMKRLEILTDISFTNINLFRIHQVLGVSNNKELWFRWADSVWEDGGEGVILKQATGIYTPEKRNSSLMKIKLEATFDLLVIDFFYSEGEKGNPAWNLKLRNKQGVEQNVRVGKSSDIEEFGIISPIGQVATIKAMKQNEEGSYREPRFQHLRPEKLPTEID